MQRSDAGAMLTSSAPPGRLVGDVRAARCASRRALLRRGARLRRVRGAGDRDPQFSLRQDARLRLMFGYLRSPHIVSHHVADAVEQAPGSSPCAARVLLRADGLVDVDHTMKCMTEGGPARCDSLGPQRQEGLRWANDSPYWPAGRATSRSPAPHRPARFRSMTPRPTTSRSTSRRLEDVLGHRDPGPGGIRRQPVDVVLSVRPWMFPSARTTPTCAGSLSILDARGSRDAAVVQRIRRVAGHRAVALALHHPSAPVSHARTHAFRTRCGRRVRRAVRGQLVGAVEALGREWRTTGLSAELHRAPAGDRAR